MEMRGTISAKGADDLIQLLRRVRRLLRRRGTFGENALSAADADAERQAIDAWLEEWAKDDHPHALQRGRPRTGRMISNGLAPAGPFS